MSADRFTKAPRKTLADDAYTQIRSAIQSGELHTGRELKQAELAEWLGVSRVTVREALRQLQAQRLVTANPFQRYVVTALTAEQVMELIELREEMELFALRRLLRSQAPIDLSAARTAAGELLLDLPSEEWVAADRNFHRALNGKDSAISLLIDDIRDRIQRYLYSASAREVRRKQVLEEHQALLDAVERRNETDVEQIIRKHVQGTKRSIEEILNEADNSPEGIARRALKISDDLLPDETEE
ncbi:GntR family transcriptional regulator [Nocardia sp. CWNU-33]|uniref:GntR family transcriptional regulator n=1 Tax=Nocardia sp. CWNU-33 TaxID=3392117 RepID=UPI00398EC50D